MAEDNKRLLILGSKSGGGGGAATWGQITGTLSDQTDLQNALNAKADSSSVPTSTSDLTNDSGFRTVVEINDMTQAELLDFYTNYTTRLTENTYVMNGYPFSIKSVTDQQYGTVLVLESNARYFPNGNTVDVTVDLLYVFANGQTQAYSDVTYNVPLSSGLATVATSGSYNDLTNKPTIPTVDVTAAGDNTFTGNNTFTVDTLIGDWSDIAINLSVGSGMPVVEGYDENTYKGFDLSTDGFALTDPNLGDDNALSINLDSTTGDVAITTNYGDMNLRAGSVTVNGTPVATTDMLPSGTNDGTNWTSLTIGTDTYAIPSGGGGNDWFGTKEMFDAIPENELDDDTNYYIADRLDYSDIANTPSIPSNTSDLTNNSDFTTNEAVNMAIYNTKKAIEDSFVFCTQSEYDAMSLAGTLKEDTKYIIQGTQNKLEMVVTFTDTTTATYNVYVE